MSAPEPLSIAEVTEMLDGLPLVPAIAGSMPEMKALRDRCLEAGIPALVGCPPGAGKGWGTKTHLLVEEDELPAVAQLLRGDWRRMLEAEGVAPVEPASDEACPACGFTGEPVDGACGDCGLHLG